MQYHLSVYLLHHDVNALLGPSVRLPCHCHDADVAVTPLAAVGRRFLPAAAAAVVVAPKICCNVIGLYMDHAVVVQYVQYEGADMFRLYY